MAVLALPRLTYEAALAHLSRRPEQVGFFLADWDVAQQQFVISNWRPLSAKDLEYRSDFHVSLKDHIRPRIIKWAWDNDASLVEAHSHGEFGAAMFSPSDLSGFEEWVPHVRWRLRGKPYAAIVTAGDTFDGLAWVDSSAHPQKLERIELTGRKRIEATGATWARQKARSSLDRSDD